MIIVPNRNRIAGRERLLERLVQLAVHVTLGFGFTRHRLYIGKAGANSKKARNTEVPTPPCSKLAPVRLRSPRG